MSDVVEAMALGIANVRRAVFNLPPVEFLTTVDPTMREQLRTEARAAIRAVTERGGLVVGKMPEEWSDGGKLTEHLQAFYDGRNHALAAVRANAVKVEGG